MILIALAVLTAGVLAHALHGAGVLGGPDRLFTGWLVPVLMWGAAAVCLARGIAVQGERFAWLALGANLLLTAIGDLMWTVHYNGFEEAPFPNWADAAYLASYPCTYAGVLSLLRSRLRPFRPSLWLDGAVGGLTLAALTAALLFGAVLS
ncbi:MAG: hypothetical protein ACRDN8_00940, partial [Thermoleophilaceae bacterium]